MGTRNLDHLTCEYLEHYNIERRRQGLEDELVEPPERPSTTASTVTHEERLGGAAPVLLECRLILGGPTHRRRNLFTELNQSATQTFDARNYYFIKYSIRAG